MRGCQQSPWERNSINLPSHSFKKRILNVTLMLNGWPPTIILQYGLPQQCTITSNTSPYHGHTFSVVIHKWRGHVHWISCHHMRVASMVNTYSNYNAEPYYSAVCWYVQLVSLLVDSLRLLGFGMGPSEICGRTEEVMGMISDWSNRLSLMGSTGKRDSSQSWSSNT